jgi:hypothetical protein
MLVSFTASAPAILIVMSFSIANTVAAAAS